MQKTAIAHAGSYPDGRLIPKLQRVMRITAVLLLAASLHVAAKTEGQNVTLKGANMPIREVFQEIHKQTGLEVLVDEQLLEKTAAVSLDVHNMPVTDLLALCLKNDSLTYTIEDGQIIVKSSSSSNLIHGANPSSPSEPPGDIRGRVTDSMGKPLSGASVIVKGKGKQKGTETDANGYFTLTAVPENSTLVISYTGYTAKQYKVNGSNDFTVLLIKSDSPLDEVQIIAYGTTTQRLNTGNVSTVKAADIEKQPVSNPLLALEGRVPGLEITQSNGIPGTGVTVRIRGQNSISNGNDPLYVVDGVPYTSQLLPGLGASLGNSGGSVGQSNVSGSPMSYINPGDIESIDVLKDADATAIYGSRGANGVILITTKKGKIGKTKFDINLQDGWGHITRGIDWMNTKQYLMMRREALRNDGATPQSGDHDINGDWDTTRYTDWQKELIGGNSQYTNAEVSVSGGNTNTQFLISGNYNKQTTVFPGNFSDQKGSLHFNINNVSTDRKFWINFSGSYLADNNHLPQTDFTSLINLAPDAPAIYNKNGTLNWQPDSTGIGTWGNPLANKVNLFGNSTNNLISNLVVGYKILPGLDIKSSFGYTNTQTNEFITNPLTFYDPGYLSILNNTYRSASFANNNIHSWIIEPQATYSCRIGKGKLETLIGGTFENQNSSGKVLNANGFNSDLVLQDINSATTITVSSTTYAVYKYNALFARLNYNLQDKYLVNVTARRDGTSRFGPANQFHNFGAVGAAWIFSKEAFIQEHLSFLSFGKLRASYGITGSDQVGDYQFMDLYQAQSYDISYQGINVVSANRLYNPDLAWEQTKKSEGGLELEFLNDRIFFTASYFLNQSSNQLLGYNLPSTTGFGNVAANQNALVRNYGWEFVMSTVNLKTKNFHWSSSINVTIGRNKLVSIGSRIYGITQQYVGQPLSIQFVYHLLGVDPLTGKYEFADGKGGTTSMPDTAILQTRNTLVNIMPKFSGGLQNSISYKAFQLDFLFQFVKQIGFSHFMGHYPGSIYSGNQPVSVLKRWQKPKDITNIQRFYQDFSLDNEFSDAQSSDASLTDASYIRLTNLSISWQLPESWRKKSHLQNCRVYAQGQNLLTITKYAGSDPETQGLVTLPPLRVFTFGLQVSL